jgi:hypothetical protein
MKSKEPGSLPSPGQPFKNDFGKKITVKKLLLKIPAETDLQYRQTCKTVDLA